LNSNFSSSSSSSKNTIYFEKNSPYKNIYDSELELRKALSDFLAEDIGTGDITSNLLIPQESISKGDIVCKSSNNNNNNNNNNNSDSGTDSKVCEIVVSGLAEAKLIFEICGCKVSQMVEDGSAISNGTIVMTVSGSSRSILKGERTALNLLMRMSGISTKTGQFVRRLGNLSKTVKIASTRKTAPGLRYFDKRAVVLGGGISHRERMDQLILIKDNHIAIVGSVKEAIKKAKSAYPSGRKKIECEVTDYQGILDAIDAGADIIMLDNFTPTQVDNSIQRLKKAGLRDKAIIEVSGGVKYENVQEFAACRPDVISIGSLTHSVQAIDFSLEIT
jgi:nicotinate-nucleotide pyrophosphorylase (carboxylating)